jgi:putative protein-disulfide isomerase
MEQSIDCRHSDDQIKVTYYTDPLCCWSWVMEPDWDRLVRELDDRLVVTYRMAGLLPSWGSFHDSLHSISKPIHMGPEWMQASKVSGVDIDDRIWIEDPPVSSFPACIAVKSAEQQSAEFGHAYLCLAREAVMTRRKNIARLDVLMKIAYELAGERPDFDVKIFRDDMDGRGRDAFKVDWKDTKYFGIRRLPTLVVEGGGQPGVVLSGRRSYEELKRIMGDRVGVK